MPAALIARLPEEPYRTTVPFVRDLRDTCETPTNGYAMPPGRPLERRSFTMMSVRSRPCLPKVNSFGYFGRCHRSASDSISYSDSGLVLGGLSRLNLHYRHFITVNKL